MSPEQFLQWVQQTYGVSLNESQISALANALGFTGGNWSPQMASQAMALVDQEAARNNIPKRTNGSPASTVTPPISNANDMLGQLQQWATETYGRPLNDGELQALIGAVGYQGGDVSPELLNQAKALVSQYAAENGVTPITNQPRPTPVSPGPPVEGSPTPGTGGIPGTGGTPAQGGGQGGFDLGAARAQLAAQVQSQYGYTLNDAQLQAIWNAISQNGVTDVNQAVSAAMSWLSNPANQTTILGMQGGGGTGGGGGIAGGGTEGGGTTLPYDQQGINVFKAWFRQTFGREATDAELQSYGEGIRYQGGTIAGTTLAQLKDIAILDQKSKGWLPVNPGQFDWTPFEYQEFQFGEQAPTFEGMDPFQFGEQAPTYTAGPGFEYGAFTAPNMQDVVRDPAYVRRLEQGQQALETSAAAKGLLRTGATLKGLTEYGQNLASEEYQNVYNRAKGEYQQGYQSAMDQYQSQEAQRQNQFNANRQSYLDRLGQAQYGYQAESTRRSGQYGAAVESWRNRYNQALQQYQTNRGSAETAWKSQREQDLLRWQRDYDVWRYYNDDAYRRAQIAATQSGT